MSVFSRIILYLLSAVLTASLGASMKRVRVAMFALSGVFLIFSFASVDKALGMGFQVIIFDYLMTAYLVALIGFLARALWRVTNGD